MAGKEIVLEIAPFWDLFLYLGGNFCVCIRHQTQLKWNISTKLFMHFIQKPTAINCSLNIFQQTWNNCDVNTKNLVISTLNLCSINGFERFDTLFLFRMLLLIIYIKIEIITCLLVAIKRVYMKIWTIVYSTEWKVCRLTEHRIILQEVNFLRTGSFKSFAFVVRFVLTIVHFHINFEVCLYCIWEVEL